MQEHLTRELFRAIHQGWRNPGDLAAIAMAHLFELCPRCREEFEGWRDEVREDASPERGRDYDPVIDGIRVSEASARDGEAHQDPRHREARSRAEELLRLPAEQQAEWIRSEAPKHTGLLLAEALIEECRQRTPGYPHQGVTLANLARLVLQHAPTSVEATQLYARALAYLANAFRVIGDLPRADQILGDARYLLASQGGGPRCVRADMDSLEASLRISQERADEAVPLLLRAVMTCRLEKNPSAGASILIKLARAHERLQHHRRALDILGYLEKELEAERDARLFLISRENSALSLALDGEPDHAREVILETRLLAEAVGDPLQLLRRSWAEARICWHLSDFENAESLFLGVSDGLSTRRLRYDEALVSLELARLYAQQHRVLEVEDLVEQALPVFQELGLPRKVAEARSLRERVNRG